MKGISRLFVRERSDERKWFFADCYESGGTTLNIVGLTDVRELSFWEARDGEQIDRMADGRFRNKFGVVWAMEMNLKHSIPEDPADSLTRRF